MRDLPLRSVLISDFRRLEGHRVLPLDAPVVLLHGPNGTGKTSVLSALELALTGDIRSMRRHDPRYTAHLPFQGQEFAAVRATVSDQLAVGAEPVTMTVGGSRISGDPALAPEAASFFAERCYLDQASLGQLLELYQYREGRGESALARFVNELLGLEQLDALQSGLSDANDFRRLKKLSEPLRAAEAEAQQADADLTGATAELVDAETELLQARAALAEALGSMRLDLGNVRDVEVVSRAKELLRRVDPAAHLALALRMSQALTTLGGRIDALLHRPSVQRLEAARADVTTASGRLEAWREQHGASIEAWRRTAAELQVRPTGAETDAVDEQLRRIELSIARQDELVVTSTGAEARLKDRRRALSLVEVQLSAARDQAGSLVEGLSALRLHVSENVCPVCDRDFSEVSSTHLRAHIDRKIVELTTEGARLRELRQHRDSVAADVQREERRLEQLRGEVWSQSQRAAAESRRSALAGLDERLQGLRTAMDEGARMHEELRSAAAQLEELEALAREVTIARSELEKASSELGTAPPSSAEPLPVAWRRLVEVADEQLARAEAFRRAHATASDRIAQLVEADQRVARLKAALTQAARRRIVWDSRVREARRRQGVARAVHDAASTARAAIIQRVFTGSLNQVWRDVFTRLAPREPFVPAFGTPETGKAGLQLRLETVHTSGVSGGPPQMMLSAGNLNTAALSLFISLHLAVEPLVPCFVLDDPIQSMDEVHIAQFAALIRVLSKHHGRQVIIAVHERELFQYLALELSPAFDGDELITIELGERSRDEDRGFTRHKWFHDRAIAT